MYSGTPGQAVQADFAQSQDTLYALAVDTGGMALLDTNDLTRGISVVDPTMGKNSFWRTRIEIVN